MDLRLEGQALQKFEKNFANHHCVRVPHVYHASKDILVMSYEEGESLGRVMSGEITEDSPFQRVRKEISSEFGRLFSKMLFKDNFVHLDLHPGNMKVRLTGADNSHKKA